MSVEDWLDPNECPPERPPRAVMSAPTRALHDGVDAHARATGRFDLNPDAPTLMTDLLGSEAMIAWQEGKASATWLGEICWSELSPVYGRYGTGPGRALIDAIKELGEWKGPVCPSDD